MTRQWRLQRLLLPAPRYRHNRRYKTVCRTGFEQAKRLAAAPGMIAVTHTGFAITLPGFHYSGWRRADNLMA